MKENMITIYNDDFVYFEFMSNFDGFFELLLNEETDFLNLIYYYYHFNYSSCLTPFKISKVCKKSVYLDNVSTFDFPYDCSLQRKMMQSTLSNFLVDIRELRSMSLISDECFHKHLELSEARMKRLKEFREKRLGHTADMQEYSQLFDLIEIIEE